MRIDIKMIFLGHHSFPCQEDSWFTCNLTLIIYFSYTSLVIWMLSLSYFLIWCMQRQKFSWRLQWLFSHHFEISVFPTIFHFLHYTIAWMDKNYVFYWWPKWLMFLWSYAKTPTPPHLQCIHCAKQMLFPNKFPCFCSIFHGQKSNKHYYNTIFPSQKLMENKGIYWKHLLVALKLPLGTTVDM